MVSVTNRPTSGKSGMLGLATGMDTEAMIDAMLSNTQLKIDKQNQLKTQTSWKQDIYRDVISQIQKLQTSYFNALNPKTNIGSATFWSTKTLSYNSSAVKVNPTGNITSNKLTINEIKQLATPSKVSSRTSVSGEIQLNVDASKMVEGATIDVNVDGISKQITLRGSSASEISSNLSSELSKAFGSAVSLQSDGRLQVNGNRQVLISGGSDGLNTLGIQNGVSNKINLNQSLANLNLKTNVAGNVFEFQINGVDFRFTSANTLNDVIRDVNNSSAGVKLSYSNLSDQFTIESKVLGSGVDISMQERSGNLMASLFQSGSSAVAHSHTYKGTTSIQASNPFDQSTPIYSGTFEFSVNGSKQSVSLAEKVDDDGNKIAYTQDEVISEVNSALAKTYGSNIQFVAKGNQMEVVTSNQYEIVFDAQSGTLAAQLGFTSEDNKISDFTKLSALGLSGNLTVNNTTLVVDADTTIQEVNQFLESKGVLASFRDGAFQLDAQSNHVEISGELSKALFNGNIELNSVGQSLQVISGSNAILRVNGMEIERSSNTFTLDGYEVSLLTTSASAIEITASDSVDDLYKGIKSFIDDYNALVDKITGLVSEKTEYRKYPPLTDAQKKEMSEKEIELWESKAKIGLVSNDGSLNILLSQMRSTLFNTPAGSLLNLADIGIATSNYADKGKLKIDEDQLKNALQTNLDGVSSLFTASTTGIVAQFKDVLNSAISTSTSKPGSLVTIAGIKSTSTQANNALSKRMDSIDQQIDRLKRTYEAEKARYWKQFSNLESVISKMNSQSSWLSQQFMG